MSNIFKDMTVPNLGDSNFQGHFEDFCNSIIQNIQRLISIQYTKGDKGDSVVTEELTSNYRGIDDKEISTGNLDAMGMAIISAIFGRTPQGTTRTALYNMLNGSLATIQVDDDFYYTEGVAPGMTVDGVEYNAIEDLIKILDGNKCNGIKLDITVDPVNGEAWLASPYLFIDGRIQGLNRMVRRHGHDGEYYKTFRDFSTAVYGKAKYDHNNTNQDKDNPLTWNWEMVTVPIVPKLYFDQEINEFCWEVNGQQTGITAQGIKGDDGISPNTIIGVGTKSGSIINIDSYQYIDEGGNQRWTVKNPAWPNPNNEDEPMFLPASGDTTEILLPKDGDIAIVFYDNADDPNDPYQAAYVGRVYINDNDTDPYVVTGWDNQGRLDIFESIRQHDFWRMMVSINEDIAGSPRGYVIPANMNDTHYESSPATQGHIAYSERSRSDSEGYGVLHVAPVKTQGTHRSSSDPLTDHIGNMQIDYNVQVQGDHSVQGVTNVNEFHAQGNVEMHQNTTVQGDLQVQGKIIGQDFTVLGKDWPTKIDTPKLAVMSRFKNTSYVLKRTWEGYATGVTTPGKDYNFTYQLIISGILELNVGKLSQYNTKTCMDAAHEALRGYGPYWTDGKTQDDSQRQAFANQPARSRSKLYDVVKYEIPFDVIKTVNSGVMRNAIDAANGGNNMWNFWLMPNSLTNTAETLAKLQTQGNSKYKIISSSTGPFNGIDLRMAITGFNNGISGPNILLNNDTNGPMVQGISGLVESTTETQGNSLQWANITTSNWVGDTQGVQGCVQSLSHKADSSANIDTSRYDITGIIYYAPLNITLDYCFDFFARLLELDVSNWKLNPNTAINQWRVDSVTFNMGLYVTPVGCVRATHNGSSYLAPIWNAINVNDVGNKSIRSNINKPGMNLPGGLLGRTYKSIGINPLIYDEYSGISDDLRHNSNGGNLVNGPNGNIMMGDNVKSQYLISIFDKKADISDHYIDCLPTPPLTTKYFDLTPNMRVVSDNVKVCPANVYDGSWKQDSDGRLGWEANEELPIAIIPYEGVIESFNGNNQPGHLKIGCCNFQTQDANNNSVPPMTLQGVLIYPYTACLVMLGPGGTEQEKSMAIKDMFNDAINNPISSIQGIQGHHFISSGRMMGVTNGEVSGMATRVVTGSTVVPDDWDSTPQAPGVAE